MTEDNVPPPDEGTLRVLWERGLCTQVARNDDRWLVDAHMVSREADRLAIAGELWKTVCSDCPVWATCLRWAVTNDEVGIWAGTTQQQRRKIMDHWKATGRFSLDLTLEDVG